MLHCANANSVGWFWAALSQHGVLNAVNMKIVTEAALRNDTRSDGAPGMFVDAGWRAVPPEHSRDVTDVSLWIKLHSWAKNEKKKNPSWQKKNTLMFL